MRQINLDHDIKSLHIKVSVNGSESFWLAPNTESFSVDDVKLEDLPTQFNWLSTTLGKSLLERSGHTNQLVGLVLIDKFGIEWVNNNINNISVNSMAQYQNPIDIGNAGVTYFVVETFDKKVYLMTKDFKLVEKDSTDMCLLPQKDYTWIDTNDKFSLDLNRFEAVRKTFEACVEDSKNLINSINKTLSNTDIDEKNISMITIYKNTPLKQITNSYDFAINNHLKDTNKSFLIVRNGIFVYKTFKDFLKEYREDWNLTCVDENGETKMAPVDYYHRHYHILSEISEFEGFLIKVYDYFNVLGILESSRYSSIKENNKHYNLGCYTFLGFTIMNSHDSMMYKFIQEQIAEIVKIFKKKKYIKDVNINELIRKFYHNNNAIKQYFRLFIDYYVDNYVKVDIENDIDVKEKYGITSNNLTNIMLSIF